MTEIVAADIGGTHARFAFATVEDGQTRLGEAMTLAVADHATTLDALTAFAARSGRPLPRFAAIAVAGRIGDGPIALTNSRWTIDRAALPFERLTLVNDFEAVAHAAAALEPRHFAHLCGPESPLPADGVISVVGPGTGLGVGMIVLGAETRVVATEGGHIGFAPVNAVEDRLVEALRAAHGRASVERVVSGPGLRAMHEALSGNQAIEDDRSLWARALIADIRLAPALDRWLGALGAVAGDIALAQGASAVVIAGGLGLRLAERLPTSPFAQRFAAKGRFQALMESLPVKLLMHPQPGLFGAAAAFAAQD